MPLFSSAILDDSCSIDDQYKSKYTRKYLVLASIDMDSYNVRAALPIGIYTVHPNDRLSLCVGISVNLTHPHQGIFDNPANPSDFHIGQACYKWEVAYEYGPWNPLQHTTTGDPTFQPLNPRFSSVNTPQACFEDVDGNPIVNSAGDYFDPPIERDFPRWTLTVTRNELHPALARIGPHANRINEATWNGFPPKTVKLGPVQLPSPEFSHQLGILFYPIEYVFEINFDTWTRQSINHGYRQLDSAGKIIPILVGGVPASSPVMLDRAGHALITPGYLDTVGGAAPDVPGSAVENTGGTGTGTGTATTVVVNAYEIYRPLDFAILDDGFVATQLLSALIF
jgi:hypothetical protein